MTIGFSELMLIFILAYFLFGKEKLLEFARSLGKCIRDFKDVSDTLVGQVVNDSSSVKENPSEIRTEDNSERGE